MESAASTGRTHGSTDQPCIILKKTLANREPSTHGTKRTKAKPETKSDIGLNADMALYLGYEDANSRGTEFGIGGCESRV